MVGESECRALGEPRTSRQATRTPKLTVPSRGTMVATQSSISPASSHRILTLDESQPKNRAPAANSQKKLLWTMPNCCGVRPRSFWIWTPANAMTDLSAKLMSMNTTSSPVIIQARRISADLVRPDDAVVGVDI